MVATTEHSGQTHWLLKQDKFLSQAELKRLIRVVARRKATALKKGRKTAVRDWFLICVATETGLRVQEIADLCCGDIQENGDWRVVVVRSGKNGKPRLVNVRRHFLEQFRQFVSWKQTHNESTTANAPVFAGHGRPMCKRALQKAFERTMRFAGIERPAGMGIHSLRHTYASFLLKASKFNMRLVQKQLGHASIKTTEVYAQVFDPDVQKAVERLYE